MNTQENNKIIADFIQAEKQDDDLYIYNGLSYYLQEMHRDWNFLMVAVEKIESLGYVFTIRQGHVSIGATNYRKPFYTGGDNVEMKKIEAVYLTCIEFIHWYNEQNK